MGKIIAKNVVKREHGYLYYRFLTEMFEPVQWMAKVMCVPLKWLEAEKRKKLHPLGRLLQKEVLREEQLQEGLHQEEGVNRLPSFYF